MSITDTQQAAQFSANAAVSAAEAKQYLLQVEQGYQDISKASQEAINAATDAEASKMPRLPLRLMLNSQQQKPVRQEMRQLLPHQRLLNLATINLLFIKPPAILMVRSPG